MRRGASPQLTTKYSWAAAAEWAYTKGQRLAHAFPDFVPIYRTKLPGDCVPPPGRVPRVGRKRGGAPGSRPRVASSALGVARRSISRHAPAVTLVRRAGMPAREAAERPALLRHRQGFAGTKATVAIRRRQPAPGAHAGRASTSCTAPMLNQASPQMSRGGANPDSPGAPCQLFPIAGSALRRLHSRRGAELRRATPILGLPSPRRPGSSTKRLSLSRDASIVALLLFPPPSIASSSLSPRAHALARHPKRVRLLKAGACAAMLSDQVQQP